VDVLQADATRCLGYTGYLIVDGLVHAANLPLSSHCAPALSVPVALAALQQRHVEWFHDHVRIEKLLFDGAPEPRNGMLAADPARPGIGLAFKEADAEQFAI
jgi:L-alanine-DL-glutamate epimerase-like enolase superfamily enzyme